MTLIEILCIYVNVYILLSVTFDQWPLDDCIDIISTMYCDSKVLVLAGPALFITMFTDDFSNVCLCLNVTNKWV